MVKFQISKRFFSIDNRYCYFGCLFIMLVLILIKHFAVIKPQQCNAIQIQKHYMNNLSISQLLQTMPIRTNFFKYQLINQQFCENNTRNFDLLIFIISKSSSFERRSAIRRTYGNLHNVLSGIDDSLSKLKIGLLFMINLNQNQMKNILYERRIFNDIVQVRIPEDNILMNIYRDLAILDWSSKYCRNARFIFKIDDSVLLNPFLLIKFLNEHKRDHIHLNVKSFNISTDCPKLDIYRPLLYGFIHSNQYVLRQTNNYNDKQIENYVVSRDEYPCEIYPDYLSDHIYLMSSDTRDLILCTFHRQSNVPLPISNIYITGILAEYLDIKRQSFNDYTIDFDSKMSCTTRNVAQTFACVINHQLSENFFLEQYNIYWQRIISSRIEHEKQ